MGNILRKAVEYRRKKIIDKLIAFNIYKKEDKDLFKLSLTELENEFRRFQTQSHPHGEYGSIKWNSKKSEQ